MAFRAGTKTLAEQPRGQGLNAEDDERSELTLLIMDLRRRRSRSLHDLSGAKIIPPGPPRPLFNLLDRGRGVSGVAEIPDEPRVSRVLIQQPSWTAAPHGAQRST